MFTYNDHFKVGLLESAETTIFYARIGECERPPQSPFQEGIHAAQLIAASTNQPIVLCLSGGIDSEAMALAFIGAKIPFEVAILRFQDDFNLHDIHYATEFCKAHNLTYKFYDLDILDFLESKKYMEFARISKCNSPQLATHMYLLDQIVGFPVMGWNLPFVERRKDGHLCIGLPNNKHSSYLRYFQANNRQGCPYFFLYTPELVYAFMQMAPIQQILTSKEPRSVGYLLKCELYKMGGYNVEPRESKFTGFEKLHEHFRKLDNGNYGAFDNLFRRPLEELYPKPKGARYFFSRKYLGPILASG